MLLSMARVAGIVAALVGALAALLGFWCAPLAPRAVAAGDGSLTRLEGKAGCLSVAGARGKRGCTRVRGLAEPRGVAVSSDGRNVYVTGERAHAVAVFRRSSRTGALRQLRGRAGCLSLTGRDGCGRARGLGYARDIELSADGRSAYVQGYESITVFRRDRRTGALRQLHGSGGCVRDRPRERPGEGCANGRGLGHPSDLALSPNGRVLYVASGWDEETTSLQGGIAVFRRDLRTGRLTQLRGARGCVTALGLEGCARARSIPRIGPLWVVLDRGGDNLYAGAFGVVVFDRLHGGGLRQLSGPSGCVTPLGAGGCTSARGFEGPRGLATSPAGVDNLYATSSYYVSPEGNHGAVVNLVRDRATGGLSQPAGSAGCITWGGAFGCASTHSVMPWSAAITLSRDGRNAYTALSTPSHGLVVFSRNRATGELTQLSGQAGCISDTPAPDCADSGGLSATAIALSRDGRNAYVTSGGVGPLNWPPAPDALAVYKRAR